MNTITYHDMELKIAYKPYQTFSLVNTQNSSVNGYDNSHEENRVFVEVDEKTFTQIQLEFNSYLLPCNYGVYLSRYSKFDYNKLYAFRRYCLTESNYNQKKKIDNYYKYFLLLHLRMIYRDIPKNKETSKICLDKYIKYLDNEEHIWTFNLMEVLAQHFYLQNFINPSEKIIESLEVLPYMTINLKDYTPLYPITIMSKYMEDRAKNIDEYLNIEDYWKKFRSHEIYAPGKKTGILNEEKFVIDRSLFLGFNRFLFDKECVVKNYYYKKLLERLASCFVDKKYDFIYHTYYTNKQGKKNPIAMVRIYSFEIKNKIPYYTEDELVKWFLNFYNYYNLTKFRFNDLLSVDSKTSLSNFNNLKNPFKNPKKKKNVFKKDIRVEVNTNKLVYNCTYQSINNEDIWINKERIYDATVNKSFIKDTSDLVFYKNIFDYDKVYINNQENFAVFKDMYSYFFTKRNFKANKNIMFRTDNFHIIAPNAFFVYNLYDRRRHEKGKAILIKDGYLKNTYLYKERVMLWKNPSYLRIRGFSLIISPPILAQYYALKYQKINSIINFIDVNYIYFERNNQFIFHYVKTFYDDKHFKNDFIFPDNCTIFSNKNMQKFYKDNNEILVSYIQLNDDNIKSDLLNSIISDMKIPKLYTNRFYSYLHSIYKNNQIYQNDNGTEYEYLIFLRINKHYPEKLAYTLDDISFGQKMYNHMYSKYMYEMCRINLLFFSGIRFPSDDQKFIPKTPYDLFLYQFLISHHDKNINVSSVNNSMVEQYYKNNKNAYERIFLKNKAIYNIFENYYNNNLNKIEYYGTIEDYYHHEMYKNNLYYVLYNYIPGKIKQFKTYYYQNYNCDKFTSLNEFNNFLNNINDFTKESLFNEYIKYSLINNYLINNYNLYMNKKYGQYFPQYNIDIYNNSEEICIEKNSIRYVFNKPNDPKSDLVYYLEDINYKKNQNENDDEILMTLDKMCFNFINDNNLRMKYKEKETKEFNEFRTNLLNWETLGYYTIGV